MDRGALPLIALGAWLPQPPGRDALRGHDRTGALSRLNRDEFRGPDRAGSSVGCNVLGGFEGLSGLPSALVGGSSAGPTHPPSYFSGAALPLIALQAWPPQPPGRDALRGHDRTGALSQLNRDEFRGHDRSGALGGLPRAQRFRGSERLASDVGWRFVYLTHRPAQLVFGGRSPTDRPTGVAPSALRP